jgi:biotin carboxylase
MHYPSTVAFFPNSVPNRRQEDPARARRSCGSLRSVQAGGSSLATGALSQVQTYPVVLKPIDSAGSDGVKLCHTFEEAKDLHTVAGWGR